MAGPGTVEELIALARDALATGREQDVVHDVVSAARRLRDEPVAWQFAGLLQRALQDHSAALDSFRAAARLAPHDSLIAMSVAQVMLEAGLDARPAFADALKLSPTGDALLGQAAARYAAGEGRIALGTLAEVLDRNPLWMKGHEQWAQLAAMAGEAGRATETIDRALAANGQSVELWQARIAILERAERHAERVMACDEAAIQTGHRGAFALARAAALSDDGQAVDAGQAFSRLGIPADIHHAIRLARHLIRVGDRVQLSRLADQWMVGADAHLFWPYASIAWRWSDDDRWRWLEGDDRFVRELVLPDPDLLRRLVPLLGSIHDRSGRFLDQSVRGGSQTDGPLLSRIDEPLRALRKDLLALVADYVRGLPPPDPRHPMLSLERRGDLRFAGSWSVRLRGDGFHTPHIHPQGWISSACYLVVPETSGTDGWLALGQPPADLNSGLVPFRMVEPSPGKLVLFPSMVWHSTLPFTEGERMTVAFDVAKRPA